MKNWKVEQSDLIGDIEGFPIEVVQKMVDEQVKQGNPADVNVFQQCRVMPSSGYGFNWNKTQDGHDFWWEVIENINFARFFEKYPKEKTFPKMMEVSDNGIDWYKRKVIEPLTSAVFVELDSGTKTTYNYSREIQPKVKITRQEIADKFGIDINNLEIE